MNEIIAVIASYNDSASSVSLAKNLISSSGGEIACLVVDDSPENLIDALVSDAIGKNPDLYGRIFANYCPKKSGRGAAVRRGMEESLSLFPNLEYVLEIDGDGSHQVEDVMRIIEQRDESALIVGSRYLRSSRISGWPASRRALSKVLNFSIPKILGLSVSDVTNGLRLYPKPAVRELLAHQAKTDSFIYLSESLLVLSRSFFVREIPIHFVNRLKGESSVGVRELLNSLNGLFKLWIGVKWRRFM